MLLSTHIVMVFIFKQKYKYLAFYRIVFVVPDLEENPDTIPGGVKRCL